MGSAADTGVKIMSLFGNKLRLAFLINIQVVISNRPIGSVLKLLLILGIEVWNMQRPFENIIIAILM